MIKPTPIPQDFLDRLQDSSVFRLRRYRDNGGAEIRVPEEYIIERRGMSLRAKKVDTGNFPLVGLTPVKESDGPFGLDPRHLFKEGSQFHTVVSEYFVLTLPRSAGK